MIAALVLGIYALGAGYIPHERYTVPFGLYITEDPALARTWDTREAAEAWVDQQPDKNDLTIEEIETVML